uniref:ERI1 exoribonuclease 2 n=1 Tax=Sinocyclocheilus anshuiensis TaxID=1608454 RepID=A0A671R9N9_9TELE
MYLICDDMCVRELGLIRKRSPSSGAHQRPSVCKQRFSFLIIIDFESTCWREKSSCGQEIIEFPAVLLNVSNGEVESEFHSYVQPQEHPVLSAFCTELTGITQDQVESAPPLHICLSRFTRWLHSLQQERGVVFETDSTGPAPSGHPCAFVTWSDWDLGVCLLYECKRKQLSVPEALKSWIDLRATYRLFYNRKPKGLRGALLDLGIQFTGREHSGLVDARNTALLAWRMVSDGCLLTVTKSLRRVSSVTGDSTPCLTPQPIRSRHGVLLTEGEEPGSCDDVLVGAEPEEPDPAGHNKTPSDHYKPARPASSSACTPLRRTDPYGPLSRFLGRSGASFSVYTDPPRTVSLASKITSPLCGCGRRARRLTVGNGGPNHGRGFYSCPVRRQSCGFFKWESGLMQSSKQNHIRTPQTCSSRPLRIFRNSVRDICKLKLNISTSILLFLGENQQDLRRAHCSLKT